MQLTDNYINEEKANIYKGQKQTINAYIGFAICIKTRAEILRYNTRTRREPDKWVWVEDRRLF